MPTPVKSLDNMRKNLTEEERQLREHAEEGVIPDRGRESRMEKPAIMTKNAVAGRYWRKVLERMDGMVPSPAPEKFRAGVCKTSRPLVRKKTSPIGVLGRRCDDAAHDTTLLRKRSVSDSDTIRR